MRAELLEDWRSVAAVSTAWNALLARTASDTIFLTWEFLDAWARAAGPTADPRVVLVWDGSTLVGVAPFYAAGYLLGRTVPIRVWRPWADHGSAGEYLDWVVDPGCAAEATTAIASVLRARTDWDALWFRLLAGWTRAPHRIGDACAAVGLGVRTRPAVFSAVDLPPSWESYENSRSPNLRSMLRRRRRTIMVEQGAEFVRCRSEEDRATLLEALFALNHRRWSAEGQSGTFVRRPLEARFYREFTPVALARGWLRLFALRLQGVVKAVQIGWAYGNAFHQMQEGFDPAGPLGLGNVLRAAVIEACIREGLERYDFLGGFTEHKRRWGAVRRTGSDVLITAPSWRGMLVQHAGVWPTGRYLRPSVLPS